MPCRVRVNMAAIRIAVTLGCLLLAGSALATNLTVSPSSAVTSSQRTFTKCWITAIHIRHKKYIHSIAEMLL